MTVWGVVMRRAFLLSVLWVVLSGAVAAAELVRMNDVKSGELLLKTENPNEYRVAAIVSTDVVIDITGPVARTKVRQKFSNPGDEWVEGVYAFPLPETAAVDHMRMVVGERIIEGVIQEKQQARKSYQKAKSQGRRASLVEQVRADLFTTSVANIAPKGSVEIEIEYQELLSWVDGQFSIRYPMAITPRYLPSENLQDENKRGDLVELLQLNSGWGVMPVANIDGNDAGGRSVSDNPPVSLTVNLNAGFPLDELFSRYHQVVKETPLGSEGEGRRRVTLDSTAHSTEHDFVLYWKPRVATAPRAAFFTEKGNGTEQHGLLMVMPPLDSALVKAPPRELTYVIDTSGSMSDGSIEQAKAALRKALARLNPDDTFNVVEFNSDADQLFDIPWRATPEALRVADLFVSRLQADGGTEMMKALRLALGKQPKGEDGAGRLSQVVFITDGAVGNEEELFRYINNHLGDRRLFTVGIGSAPNSYFMRKSASFGRGTFTYIGDSGEVAEKMNTLFTKMEQAVMTDIEVRLEGVEGEVVQMLPEKIPDLYRGEPVVISMKMRQIPTKAVLSGTLNGREWRSEVSLAGGAEQAGLGVLFGRGMIESWMDKRVVGADEVDVRNAIIHLAYRYHLVSKYTSLVAVDMTPTDKLRELEQNEVRMKHSLSSLKLAKTATSSEMQMAGGAMLLLLSLLLFRRRAVVG